MLAWLNGVLKSGVDPKCMIVLVGLIDMQKGIGAGAISLTNMIPDSWIPHVTAWNTGLAWIGIQLLGVLAALSSKDSGPLISKIPLPSIDTTKAVANILIAAFVLSLFLAGGSAQAAAPKTPATPTLKSYLAGQKHILRIPNPLGLPDPLCVTDHPSASCDGTNATMSGNAGQDLLTLLKNGGVALVRDMKRADAYLSMPATAGCVSTPAAACAKVDGLTSSCLEGIIPIAEMVINGPAAPAGSTPPAAPAAGATAPARTTTSPPIDVSDEGIITGAAKLDIVLLALNGDPLKQACGGWITAKVQQGVSFEASIVQFITTLGVAAAAVGA